MGLEGQIQRATPSRCLYWETSKEKVLILSTDVGHNKALAPLTTPTGTVLERQTCHLIFSVEIIIMHI